MAHDHHHHHRRSPHSVHDKTEQAHHAGPDFRFCPQCGGKLKRQQFKPHEPHRRVCQACSFIFYDDPKVAACTIPVIDGKVVLLKRGIEPSYGKWVFPGGFLDRGEKVEAAAIRETWEEVNLKVEISRLLNVYSYPGYPVIVIVYLADVIGGELQPMDETLEVRTFTPEEIPWEELAFMSTRDALRDYLTQLGLRLD
ncbi:MAG TPA: NUDIX hydrolase [Methylomirabilota bacterium]|jgi:ADP-ribose pyrophosphatase YjhB (NUDIX family)|nr:NUDIX hydrolase [Methylomirabilota bacterium]